MNVQKVIDGKYSPFTAAEELFKSGHVNPKTYFWQKDSNEI